MRVIFLSMAMLILLPFAFCQNSVPSKSTVNISEKERWNLDKYVWSHTHYKTGSTDKPVIDFQAIDNWEGVDEGVTISDDGKYFAYKIITGRGVASYNRKKPDSLIIQSTSGSWRFSYAGTEPGFFSSNSDLYIFQNKNAINFVKLGKDQVRVVNNVSSYKTKTFGKNEWLAYQLEEADTNLILVNLVTGKERCFGKIEDYNFDKSGKWLTLKINGADENLLMYNLQTGIEKRFRFVESCSLNQPGDRLLSQTLRVKGTDTVTMLQYSNLSNNETKTVWESNLNEKSKVTSYSFDHSGRQVLYVLADGSVQDQKNMPNYTIWYYHENMKNPLMIVDNGAKGIPENYILQGTASFTDNGQYIRFFILKKTEKQELLPDPVSVDVWSSQDKILQSTQSYLNKQIVSYACVINIKSNSVIVLENDDEKLYDFKGDFALIKRSEARLYGDRFWEKDYDKDSNFLVSLKDGSRHSLTTRGWKYTLWFSPDGRYLVYSDGEKGCHYFSYDLQSGITKKISIGVEDDMLGIQVPFLITDEKPNFPVGTAGWLDDGRSLLVYDKFDIWQLDLRGEKPAINITNGYGRTHHLYLGLFNSRRGQSSQRIIPSNEPFYLSVFNSQTKENGFYLGSPGKASDPKNLYMGHCFFSEQVGRLSGLSAGMNPVKAKEANTWIVMRQTPFSAPNFYLTKDFISYQQLTNLQPQRNYNWVATKLVTFKQLDGTPSQGVLYLPENFDSTKKYPVIISFYVQLSNRLYQYPTPSYIEAPFLFDSPAWMASHGYLVFTPDIYFKKSEWGPSTVSAIDGAARHLKSLPYVDSTHLAATGHSNSGRFGYYLLTHSHSFAAMSIGGGVTNVISTALRLSEYNNKGSILEWAERSAYGAGGLGSLWENKNKWIDHSPVLQADEVTAPLLMFHNKEDGAESAGSALEMFLSLRRLEKPIWWLQYDKEGHTLTYLEDLRDFTIRFTQFFDHYLKGAPMPVWMREGISHKEKMVESGYDLK